LFDVEFQVWGSDIGDLLHTVKDAHCCCVNMLVPHPHDATRVASIGEDGTLHMWCVGLTGMLSVRAFNNILETSPESDRFKHGVEVSLLCGVFSPDGFSIAVSDMVGRWTLYGTGHRPDETAQGKNVPLEQYF
ncbi:unnamed protein product, partial [Ectocarpus sp. 13 AM-2016]